MSEDPLLDDLNAFIAERYEYFMIFVWPKVRNLIEVAVTSKEFDKEYVKGYGESRFKMRGVKFNYRAYWKYTNDSQILSTMYLKIKHKYKTVLEVTFRSGENVGLHKFHECGWIKLLEPITEDIEMIEASLRAKKLAKLCKDYEKLCD